MSSSETPQFEILPGWWATHDATVMARHPLSRPTRDLTGSEARGKAVAARALLQEAQKALEGSRPLKPQEPRLTTRGNLAAMVTKTSGYDAALLGLAEESVDGAQWRRARVRTHNGELMLALLVHPEGGLVGIVAPMVKVELAE